jgi:hypothetical protein
VSRSELDAKEIHFIHTPRLSLLLLLTRGATTTFSHLGVCLMTKTATKRRAWTPEHVRTLKTMARQKKKASRIAKTLKRSEGATRQKALSMGLSLDSRV